jgi:hypothetical protein
MSNLLVPQLPSLRAFPEKADDPATVPVPSRKPSLNLTMSESTLPSTAKVSSLPKFPIGVQRSYSNLHYTKTFTLHTTLQYPSILARFIAHMDWFDLYSLLCTCRHIRDLFQDTSLRDVFLTRYVVGYGHCLRTRDLNHFQDVPISIHDLDLLCTSTNV